MNKITQSIIDTLTERRGDPRLTIYMPTHQISTPPTIQEDQTRYKNLIREAHDKWSQQTDKSKLEPVFEKLESVYEDDEFWQKTSRSLAIFADEDNVEFYHLPIETESRVHIGPSFDLTPLYIAKNSDQEFYLLALAMHEPKLFKGDAYGLEPVEIDLPTSPEEALNIDEMFANSNTQRGFEGAANSNHAISMHGAGDSSEAGREERLQYFRIIDAMLSDPKYVDTSLPVLVAATDSEAGDYKAHSKLPHLMEAYVPGNHTKTELHELHDHAWALVESELCRPHVSDLVEQFNEKKGVQKASSDIDDIREAIQTGRVDTMLVRMIEQTNDSVRDTTRQTAPLIRFDDQYEQSDIGLLVEGVTEQGGKIVGVDHNTLDVPSMVAAIYRY